MITISDIKNKNGNSIALIVLCCRIYFKTSELEDLKSFVNNNQINWNQVIKTCSKHRIRPVVYKILLKIEIPHNIRVQINLELKNISIQNIQHALETERIIILLKENNINAIPYKGVAFSKQFYDDFNQRESGDIDLIINPEDLPKIIQIMEKEDFKSLQSKYYYRIGYKRFIKTHKDFCYSKFTNEKREFLIEFHFNIVNKSIYLPKKINYFNIDNTVQCKLINLNINFINPIQHFKAVYLHHILQDQLGHLKTIIDLAQGFNLLEKHNKNIHKDDILKGLEYTNIELVKKVINQILNTDFKTDEFKITEANNLINFILGNSYRKIRKNKYPIIDGITFNYSNFRRTKLFYLKQRDKLKYSFKLIFSFISPQPIDYMIFKINKKFHFLYYIARPLRLIFLPQDPKNATKNNL